MDKGAACNVGARSESASEISRTRRTSTLPTVRLRKPCTSAGARTVGQRRTNPGEGFLHSRLVDGCDAAAEGRQQAGFKDIQQGDAEAPYQTDVQCGRATVGAQRKPRNILC